MPHRSGREAGRFRPQLTELQAAGHIARRHDADQVIALEHEQSEGAILAFSALFARKPICGTTFGDT
jgi:hypothetical protein